MGRTRRGSPADLILRLREWRMRRGYSIQEWADRARVSRMTVFRIESGRSSPTVAVLEKLAQALEIAVRDLFRSARRARRGKGRGRALPLG
jgi:transcriptional regulator with XRE-family HTH domain